MRTIEMVVQTSPFTKITDDKEFMNKFILLLLLIMGLSTYIIFSTVNEVDNLSTTFKDRLPVMSLEVIEREMNGNLVSLEIVEDDFSELESTWFVQKQKENISQMKESVATVKKDQIKTDVIVHKAPIIKKVKPKKKIFISSEVSSKKSDSLSFIKKKFYATNSAKLSIKLAKKFYELKSYKKALKWVLITNEIDSKSEDSWLMFAKVKDKMGKPNDAITALNQYLKQNSSTRVKKLLIDLKKRV